MLPVFESFLHQFLPMWSASDDIDCVLSLLSRLKPCAYEELYGFVLRHLQKVFFTSSVVVKVNKDFSYCVYISG
jgi:hypothetical protein